MARSKIPTIPDNKTYFYREQLYRELSHIFAWEGLPETVPADYLERTLVRHGYVLYYEDERIGQDVLRCTVTGYNRHQLPVAARTYTPNTVDERTQISRNIKRLTDHKNVEYEFDAARDGVLICNMEYGQSTGLIVDHFSKRLALSMQAFDTNLLWSNIPYIFQTSTDETKLSIESMFSRIFEGEPFIITDKNLFVDNKDRAGVPSGIKFICNEILDVQNEIMMKFREAVGFDTAGVDKAERVNTLEIKSNNQHTTSVVDIMLQQRQIACAAINAFFGQNISVKVLGQVTAEKEDDPLGTGNNGTEKLDPNGF